MTAVALAELPADPYRAVAWQDRARCTRVDPELFFPERGTPNAHAKQVCGECEVPAECLAYALRHRLDGIWGGTSEHERRDMRKAAGLPDELPAGRELQPCGSEAAYTRHLRRGEPTDTCGCREAASRRNHERDIDRAAENARRRAQYAAGKCEKCHYRLTSDNHRNLCRGEA